MVESKEKQGGSYSWWSQKGLPGETTYKNEEKEPAMQNIEVQGCYRTACEKP